MPDGAGRRARLARLHSGQWLGLTAGALVVVALAGLVVCLVALHNLSTARRTLVDRVDPARVAASALLTALVDEETALPRPSVRGAAEERRARAALQDAARSGVLGPALTADLRAFDGEIERWHAQKAGFARVRTSFSRFDAALAARRKSERARLRHAANAATVAVVVSVGLLLAAALAAWLTLRRVVARPLRRLARDARQVAAGDLQHPVTIQGPRDIIALSADVESMRRRIIDDLDEVTEARAQLEEQTVELQRSNAELEQFAYVASHDLQEPLRKVASFCGMLQQRYHGQLDARADQYIDFAVDGAKRMQVLINDLLAFSRVGRTAGERQLLDLDEVVVEAVGNLGAAIEEAGATVEVAGPLPQVRGDKSLLVALVQNLIGNAVKFRGEAPPHVRIAVDGGTEAYRFAVDDNGIGIAPRYADRIFVIFQRLHPKEEYTGTGIGLAMCRKIVEWHGGEIWLEEEGALGGASFHFTLPVPEPEEQARMSPAVAGEDEA